MTYAVDRLWEEVAYVAYYLHWSLDSILDLEHPVRQQVINQVGRIHERMAEDAYDRAEPAYQDVETIYEYE
jgi:hypothetical protein